MVRILHLSDIHFGAENPAAIAGAADFVRAKPFDLLVISGDITQFGAAFEFEAAKRWFATLPGPMLFTPGNHDTPYAGLSRLVAPFALYESGFGPAWSDSFACAGLAVQALNTARGVQIRLNWSKGALRPGQARAAADALEAAPAGALKVAVCHHPLHEIVGGPMTGRVRGGPRGAAILAEAKTDLVLTGHIHAPFAMALPFGDRRTYAVGAGTLSLRERGNPPGFNVIEADAECITVTALAWAGSHYDSYRTWALPRRAATPQ
jgi:3',5'-cyclic AMP phosphodiesterase CpdA